jgi:hypothetical protein
MVVGKSGKAVTIRFPKGMVEELAAHAERNGRSRNSEIVSRLRRTLKKKAVSNQVT